MLFSFAPYALAADPTPAPENTWYNSNFQEWYAKVYDPGNPSEIFGERYTAAQVQWIFYGVMAFIFNTTLPGEAVACLFSNSSNIAQCKEAVSKLVPSVSAVDTKHMPNKSIWALVFSTNRPLSGIGYISQKIRNFSLVPTANAQTLGFGFDALKPVQDMWRASRDAAFGLFVIAAIVFAFMIMFRVKISPQVVISVQTAIPKLVIALILVTFSYAIAGLLVDLMYIVIGLLSVILASFIPKVLGISLPPSWVFGLLTQGNILNIVGININTGIFGLIFAYLSPLILGFLVLALVIGTFSAGLLFWIPLGILLLVIAIAIWMSLKIIWSLTKAFVNIILLTIFGPLQIVIGTFLPSFGFGQWIKSYISNLSVFVVTGVLWFLAIIFLAQGVYIGLRDIAGDIVSILLNPLFGPVIGGISLGIDLAKDYSSWPPLLGMGSAQGVGLLFLGVSFVLFTLIPKSTEIIQGLLSGRPFAYGTAIGEAFGPVSAAYGLTLGPRVEAFRRGYGQKGVEDDVAKLTELVNNLRSRFFPGSQKAG